MDGLMNLLESELATIKAVEESYNPDMYMDDLPGYRSVVKMQGMSILPPVMTQRRREEMKMYKNQAVLTEARLRAKAQRKLLERVQQVVDRFEEKSFSAPPEDLNSEESLGFKPVTEPAASVISAEPYSGISSRVPDTKINEVIEPVDTEPVDTVAEVTDLSSDAPEQQDNDKSKSQGDQSKDGETSEDKDTSREKVLEESSKAQSQSSSESPHASSVEAKPKEVAEAVVNMNPETARENVIPHGPKNEDIPASDASVSLMDLALAKLNSVPVFKSTSNTDTVKSIIEGNNTVLQRLRPHSPVTMVQLADTSTSSSSVGPQETTTSCSSSGVNSINVSSQAHNTTGPDEKNASDVGDAQVPTEAGTSNCNSKSSTQLLERVQLSPGPDQYEHTPPPQPDQTNSLIEAEPQTVLRKPCAPSPEAEKQLTCDNGDEVVSDDDHDDLTSVLTPGPNRTPDVSCISHAPDDSLRLLLPSSHSELEHGDHDLKQPIDKIVESTKLNAELHDVVSGNPSVKVQLSSTDMSVCNTASTDLRPYMAGSINTVSAATTMPHAQEMSTINSDFEIPLDEMLVTQRETENKVETAHTADVEADMKQKNNKEKNVMKENSGHNDTSNTSSSSGHVRRDSYTLAVPSPALIAARDRNMAPDQVAGSNDSVVTDCAPVHVSTEDLMSKPVQRKLEYDSEESQLSVPFVEDSSSKPVHRGTNQPTTVGLYQAPMSFAAAIAAEHSSSKESVVKQEAATKAESSKETQSKKVTKKTPGSRNVCSKQGIKTAGKPSVVDAKRGFLHKNTTQSTVSAKSSSIQQKTKVNPGDRKREENKSNLDKKLVLLKANERRLAKESTAKPQSSTVVTTGTNSAEPMTGLPQQETSFSIDNLLPAIDPGKLHHMTEEQLLHRQMEYFDQIKQQIVQQQQKQLAALLAQQQQEQFRLQQELLLQEQQLLQGSIRKARESLGQTAQQASASQSAHHINTSISEIGNPMVNLKSPLMPDFGDSLSTVNDVSSVSQHLHVLRPHTAPVGSLHAMLAPNDSVQDHNIVSESETAVPLGQRYFPSVNINADLSLIRSAGASQQLPIQHSVPGQPSAPGQSSTGHSERLIKSPPATSKTSSLNKGSPASPNVTLRRRPAWQSPISKKPLLRIGDKVPETLQPCFTRLTAAVRGYLTRRLLRTEKVNAIIKTIKDTAQFALNFQAETPIKKGIYSQQDKILQQRIIAQLTAGMYEIHEIFFQTSIKERMSIIRQDRMLNEERLFKASHEADKKKHVSAATHKAMERKKKAQAAEMAVFGTIQPRPKTAPPSVSSPKKRKADDTGAIKRQYQALMKKALKPIQAKASPVLPEKDNSKRVLGNEKNVTQRARTASPKRVVSKMARRTSMPGGNKTARRSLYGGTAGGTKKVTKTQPSHNKTNSKTAKS